MAFLHSVLNDVYEKQPYKVGKESHLKSVVDALNEKLCSGHDGFKRVIDLVADGVGRYNKEVERSNRKIKSKIERLLEQVGEEFESMITKIPGEEIFGKLQYIGEQVSDAKLFAENYVGYGATFESRLEPLEENINDLNSQCKNNVTNVRKQIKHETERLRKLSEKEWKDLKSMEMKITTVLQKLGVDVNAHISREVKTLVENLKALVQKIKDLLNDTFKKLGNCVLELENWMKNADTMVNSAMEGTTEIADKKPGKNNQDMINAKAGQVKDWSGWLERYITQLTELTSKVNLKIEALAGEFKDIKTGVPKDIKEIFGHIRNKVAYIKGTNDALYLGLEGVKEKVKEYAKYFKNNLKNKGAKIDTWIDGIFKTNPHIHSWLNDYVKQNVSKGKLKDLSYEEHNRNAVRDAIKEEIRVLIEHIKDEPDGGKPTAELNLKDIQKYLEAVAAAIETHVEPIAAEKLATKIETVSLSISDAAPNTKPYLRGAIEVTLLELSLMIKCFAGELQSFLLKPETDNIAAKIEETYGNAETLNGQLNEATGHPAGSSGKPNHAKNLDEAIEAVKTKR
ncbi:hypothetical protein, conserved [Babesia ovata]|uniref:Extracellular matrix-binding ebh n=1 Tax=Babesia ovata TaxID=189622 RepID=A0A2H6KJX4_9APIC|nr:uncharacterized protein BOVATA_047730 [Babesia ovata]GBE63280.1 hypothetical protein, conserved [Babesia ovata]